MKNLLMSKGLKIGCKVAGWTLVGAASVMGAAQTDEATQKVIKIVAKKFVKKQVGA